MGKRGETVKLKRSGHVRLGEFDQYTAELDWATSLSEANRLAAPRTAPCTTATTREPPRALVRRLRSVADHCHVDQFAQGRDLIEEAVEVVAVDV